METWTSLEVSKMGERGIIAVFDWLGMKRAE